MDSWEKFNEVSLPNKKSFYSESFYKNLFLNKEGITDGDYIRAQKVREVFKIKNLGEYYDL